MEFDSYNVAFLIISFAVFAIMLHNILQHVIKVAKVGLPTGRYLGVYERLFNLCHEERGQSSTICLVLSLKSRTKLSMVQIRNALTLLARRQPMLRAVMVKSERDSTLQKQGTYFKIIESDKIPAMLDISASRLDDWNEAWGEITTKAFSKLQWRVVLLQDEYVAEKESYRNTLVFSFNHACIDGVSCIKFAKQFLENLNSIAERSDADKSPLPLECDVTRLLNNGRESMLKFLTTCWGLSYLSRLLIKQKIRGFLSKKQRNPFFVEFPSNLSLSSPPTTKILHKVYTEAETTKILNACKGKNCTVTGALMAAAHVALCQMLKSRLHKDDFKLEHSLAINAKRYCKPTPPEDYFGHFALPCNMTLEYVDNGKEFWQLAQKSTKKIHKSLQDQRFIDLHVAMCESFNFEELLDEVFSPREQAELNRISVCNSMSSAGSFNFNEGLTDPVHELDYCLYWTLVQYNRVVLFYYNVTVNGKMSWVCAYDCSRVSDQKAEQMSNWCFENMLRYSQDA